MSVLVTNLKVDIKYFYNPGAYDYKQGYFVKHEVLTAIFFTNIQVISSQCAV